MNSTFRASRAESADARLCCGIPLPNPFDFMPDYPGTLCSKSDPYRPGNLVFFDDLKHAGFGTGRDSFYHAESNVGTNLSRFDPYWRAKIAGIRRLPVKTDRKE